MLENIKLPIVPKNFDEIEFPYVDDNDWVWFAEDWIVYRWVKTKWSGTVKQYYENRGYNFTKLFDTFFVDVRDLPEHSSLKILAYCSICNDYRIVSKSKSCNDGDSRCNKHKGFVDLTKFAKFGKLTPLEFFYQRNQAYWVCRCDCGNIISVRSYVLLAGVTLSCGCYHSEIMKGRKGIKHPPNSKHPKGANNHRYNPNLTDEEREMGRNYPEYQEWRKAVYDRDNYTCQNLHCSDESNYLNAHQLDDYSTNKNLRTDINNGITLCEDCHKDFHLNYMGGWKIPCTKQDYVNWVKYQAVK